MLFLPRFALPFPPDQRGSCPSRTFYGAAHYDRSAPGRLAHSPASIVPRPTSHSTSGRSLSALREAISPPILARLFPEFPPTSPSRHKPGGE